MIDISTPKGRIVASLLRLASEKPWRDVTMIAVADAAGLSLVDVRREFEDKRQMLSSFGHMIDAEVLAKAPRRQPDQPARDAIFDVVMSRFDALAPYKAALKSAYDGGALNPSLLKSLLRSQTAMLQAAGVDTETPAGKVRVAGLAAVFVRTFSTWIGDDDPQMSRTMAALDRHLRSGERSLQMLDSACGTLRHFREIIRPGRRSRDATPASGPEPHTPEPDPGLAV